MISLPTCWEGSSFPDIAPSNDTVNSESVIGFKPGDSGVMISCQVHGFTCTWLVEHFIAQLTHLSWLHRYSVHINSLPT